MALLQMAIENELEKRKKLDHVNTIDDVVNLIHSSNNIIVLVGAGQSTQMNLHLLQE
jgi:NAD+-dependent protein deacetylase SIR2